jgi:hypothetical protein
MEEVKTNSAHGSANSLDEIKEAIALLQVLELNDHCDAYDQIHEKLEEALKAIDGA